MNKLQSIVGSIAWPAIDQAILRVLSRSRGGIIGSMIGTSCYVSRYADVAEALDRLEGEGCISRRYQPGADRLKSPSDRSFTVYEITPKGKERIDAAQ